MRLLTPQEEARLVLEGGMLDDAFAGGTCLHSSTSWPYPTAGRYLLSSSDCQRQL
jgi:hypothetical protein